MIELCNAYLRILERQHGEQALHQAQQNLRKFQAHLEDVHADLTELKPWR